MWTPRRIVLLAFGFLLFFGTYLGYGTSYIGRIDGLPPLPPAYWNPLTKETPPPPRRHTRLEEKLTQAFGPNCPELTRPIRVELHSRNMVVAAAEYQITPEGQVSFNLISVVMCAKDRGDGQPVEMNTIRGDVALLTFDRPVTNLSEIGSRKVVEARLDGRIEVVSNRRRPQRDQDLKVQIAKGPLFYNEPRHLIWTQDWVHLVDHKPKPHPHDVRGQGMEMELLAEPRPNKPGAPPRRGRSDSITGVKRIALHSAVDMHLYVDGKSGFLGGQAGANKPAAGAPVPAGEAPPPAGPSTPPSHVHITTPGRFTYDIFQDHDLARFEVPDAAPEQRVPMDVTVVRHHPAPAGPDQLICQYLELRIHRKDRGPAIIGGQQPPAQAPAKEARPGEAGLDIETAHALRRGSKEVVLTSDSEKLVARGHDFFYDARKGLTVLKGEPTMEANKDGSLIVAREMRILDIKSPLEAGPGVVARVDPGKPAPRTHQEVTAQGPGEIHLMDKATERRTLHAYWQDKLVSSKDGPLDLLVLTGDARFVDEKDEQNLKADTIKVWLEPAEKPRGASTSTNTSPQQSHRPQHLDASGRVIARSRELNINDSNRLVVWFKNVPVEALPSTDRAPGKPERSSGGLTPARSPGTSTGGLTPPRSPGDGGRQVVVAERPAAPVAPSSSPPPYQPGMPLPAISSPPGTAGQTVPQVAGPRGGATLPAGPIEPAPAPTQPVRNPEKDGPALNAPAESDKPRGENARPIDLKARSVEVWVLRSPVRNQLDKVWCEGDVHVRQDASRPEEKDTTVDGQTLQLTWTPLGNLLTVTGDLAQLRMDKIYIIGPEVNIDQAKNIAWVHGVGAMQMDSKTNFQGEAMQKAVPLTVHWNKSMFFDGASAEFHGGIQAEQEKARLACHQLQVFFDRTISLKEGNKGGQEANVRYLVCDQEVRLEDSSYQGEQLVKYQRIEGRVVEVKAIPVDAPPGRGGKGSAGNQMVVYGPGTVRIWQPGSVDPLAPPEKGPATAPKPAAPAPRPGDKPDETKMTYVAFQRRMNGDSQKKTAKFWGGVRVLNLPCKNPNMPLDLDTFLAINPMPEGAMYMRCERLEVLDEVVNGKSNQQMEAHDKVYVQAREFYARADSVYYNQAKDQVIFDGTKSGQTTLWKIVGQGTKPQEITGKKIIYSRKTGKTDVIEADGLSGESVPGGK
jgi:lipopolysaccharide export system protein LptA